MIDANKLKKVNECKGRLKELVGDEGIMQLAKDGILPHYIITNPITKEESYWFVPSELKEWLESNLVKYQKGHFSPQFHFNYFDKDLMPAKSLIPQELSRISDLFELPLEILRTPPGIYFLCKDGKIVYIGQTANVARRITDHLSQIDKEFDTVFYISCPLIKLRELESALLRYYKPPLNLTCRINPYEVDVEIVDSLKKTA